MTDAIYSDYFTLNEVKQLQIDDKIDFKTSNGYDGYYEKAKIVGKDEINNRLLILFLHVPKETTYWCDYTKELYRFAKFESMTQQKAKRLTHLKIGDDVYIYPTYNPYHKIDWYRGKIWGKYRSQIKVRYTVNHVIYDYVTHLNNEDEVAGVSLYIKNQSIFFFLFFVGSFYTTGGVLFSMCMCVVCSK